MGMSQRFGEWKAVAVAERGGMGVAPSPLKSPWALSFGAVVFAGCGGVTWLPEDHQADSASDPNGGAAGRGAVDGGSEGGAVASSGAQGSGSPVGSSPNRTPGSVGRESVPAPWAESGGQSSLVQFSVGAGEAAWGPASAELGGMPGAVVAVLGGEAGRAWAWVGGASGASVGGNLNLHNGARANLPTGGADARSVGGAASSDGGRVASGGAASECFEGQSESRIRYPFPEGQCCYFESQFRSCIGQRWTPWSGTYEYSSCVIVCEVGYSCLPGAGCPSESECTAGFDCPYEFECESVFDCP